MKNEFIKKIGEMKKSFISKIEEEKFYNEMVGELLNNGLKPLNNTTSTFSYSYNNIPPYNIYINHKPQPII